MQIINPLQMNDWEIKKFLIIVFSIQITVWGLISLDAIGLHIPILRQLIAFIYLTFIPGVLILRILKLHKLSNIETLLYTVGLSLSTLMFTGFFMNMLYPLFGISGPISLVPLIVTISIVILLLCVLCYVRDKDFSYPSYIKVRDVLSPSSLFLCLIPFLSIFGTYLMNLDKNNVLLMFLLIIVGAVIILIAFDKFISTEQYPLAVFVISISLLYFTSLISPYIWGWDIQHEFYLSNLVIKNSMWDWKISYNTNAMLSIVMLAPIFSIISKINLIWVFKIIYPFIYSLVPIGLYKIFQKQTNYKIAFLSVFFFMATFSFYGEMLALARQQIAELFFTLLILLMVDRNMDKIMRTILLIVFGISLVVSHYGLSYIYMFFILFTLMIIFLVDNLTIRKFIDNYHSKLYRKYKKVATNSIFLKIEYKTISPIFVLLFISFTLVWYMYTSGSSSFDTIVHIGDHIARNIFSNFLSPDAAQGLNILINKNPPMHEITKILHIIAQFFIILGLLSLLLNRRALKFEREYIVFALMSVVILFACISIPFFSAQLQTSRFYHIAQFTLAPFCILGSIKMFEVLIKMLGISWNNIYIEIMLKTLSIFFVIFLLFNSGFIYELAGETNSTGTASLVALDANYDYACFNNQEIVGANWLHIVKDNDNYIYADGYRWLLIGSLDWEKIKTFPIQQLPKYSYIYLGTLNIKRQEVISSYINNSISIFGYNDLTHLIEGKNMIYFNGGAQVFY